jgi:hypothetical protein
VVRLGVAPGYDVRPPWADGPLPPGLTAILRVKDEARTPPPWTLPQAEHGAQAGSARAAPGETFTADSPRGPARMAAQHAR